MVEGSQEPVPSDEPSSERAALCSCQQLSLRACFQCWWTDLLPETWPFVNEEDRGAGQYKTELHCGQDLRGQEREAKES